MSLPIQFEQPWLLSLLVLVPAMLYASRHTLTTMGQWKFWTTALLRSTVLSAIITALAGIQWVRIDRGCSVVYLIDRSASISASTIDNAVRFINQEIKQNRNATRNDRVAVITFASEAAVEIPPTDQHILLPSRFSSDMVLEETNLASALRLAQSILTAQQSRRVVVVSDGNVTEGDVSRVAAQYVRSGIGIDVIAIASQSNRDVLVEKVQIPTNIRENTPFDIRIALAQHSATGDNETVRGQLTITRKSRGDEKVIAIQPVEFDDEKAFLYLQDELTEPGFYTYEAALQLENSQADTHWQNNAARTFTEVRGAGEILVVIDTFQEDQQSAIADILREAGMEVTIVKPEGLPETLTDLQAYDLIVLDNVAYNNGDSAESIRYFTKMQLEMLLLHVRQMGAGLLTVGGENSYGAGGWRDTVLETAMPIDFHIQNRKVEPTGALMLVIDSSGSMAGQKLQLAKAAAIAAIRSLSPRDSVGIVSFDSEPHEIVPLQPVRDGKHVQHLAGRLGASGGTFMEPAVQIAFRRLEQSDASLKHVVVLSDGQTHPGQDPGLVQRMQQTGITVTTVGIGDSIDRPLLSSMATQGRGKFYHVVSPQAIPQIFMREARRVSRPLIYESEDVIPIAVRFPHEVLTGIGTPLPPTNGFVMTTPKDQELVQVILEATEPSGQTNAILSSWQFGAGRSVALTTDLGKRWSKLWPNWGQRDKFVIQVARWAMRPAIVNDALSAVATVEDGQIKVVLNALDESGEHLDFLNPTVNLIGPDNRSHFFLLQQQGPGRYVASTPLAELGTAEQTGEYLLRIAAGPNLPSLRLGVDVNHTAEFIQQYDRLTNLKRLAAQRPRGGESGVMVEMTEMDSGEALLADFNSFRDGLAIGRHQQPAWHLMVFAACLVFFFDVLARRIRLWGARTMLRLQSATAVTRVASVALAAAGPQNSLPPTSARPTNSSSPEEDSYTRRLMRAKQSTQRKTSRE